MLEHNTATNLARGVRTDVLSAGVARSGETRAGVDGSARHDARSVTNPSQHSKTTATRSATSVSAEYYPWLTSGIATVLLFIILVQWIKPLTMLSAVTGIHVIEPFLMALFCFVTLDYLRMHAWIAWPFKLAVIWVIISMFYYESSIYEWSWWQQYSEISFRDIEYLAIGRVEALSGENRTFLLLLGIAIIVYSLHYIIVRRQYCGWFTALTISYLAGLQLGFGLDTTIAIIITLCSGLLMTVILQPVRWTSQILTVHRPQGDKQANRQENKQGVKQRVKTPNSSKNTNASVQMQGVTGAKRSISSLGALCILCLALAAGHLSALNQPKLSEPIHWDVQQFVRDVTSLTHGRLPIPTTEWQGVALSGYSFEDYPLGGSVIPSDTAVFTAESERLTYWRGETKAHYNGQGWEDGWSDVREDLREGGRRAEVSERDTEYPYSLTNGSTESQTLVLGYHVPSHTDVIQEVEMDSAAALFLDRTIFAGGVVREVLAAKSVSGHAVPSSELVFSNDPTSGRYRLESEADPVSYTVRVTPIMNDGIEPQRVDTAYAAALERGTAAPPLSTDERERYLQLPVNMSERIYSLASSLTTQATDDLERSRAIASHLRANYAYDLQEPEVLDVDEEFVDHFLFEQKLGYCDHFSTAMAVMLRMNGIPSRWVKGFAPGDVSVTEEGKLFSDVRALHAHSWVEAYIEELGWVAFEPTPSYAGSLSDAVAAAAVAAVTDIEHPERGSGSQDPAWWQGAATIIASQAAKEVEQMDGDWLAWAQDTYNRTIEGLEHTVSANGRELLIWLISGVAVAVLLWFAWFPLRRWLRYARIERTISKMERRGGTTIMLEQLWQDVFRKYGRPQPGQTLREYVGRLDARKTQQQEALVELALLYESVRYDQRLPERISRSKLSRLWRTAVE